MLFSWWLGTVTNHVNDWSIVVVSQIISQRVNPSGAETGIFRSNWVNTKAVDDLAPSVARSSAAMVLTMQDKQILSPSLWNTRNPCAPQGRTLTHWGRVTYICISNLTIIGSENGLSPCQRQAIIWTSAGILLIGPSGTNFNEILIEIHTFSFKKMHLKISSGKWRPFCLGLNVLTNYIFSNLSVEKW